MLRFGLGIVALTLAAVCNGGRTQHGGSPMKRSLAAVAGSPYSMLVFAVLIAASLVLNVVALAGSSRVDRLEEDLAVARANVTALETQVGEMGDGVTRILGLAFEIQSGLTSLGPEVRDELEAAAADLAAFRDATLTFPVDINETIPIQSDIALQRTLEVPIDTAIPINETVSTTITVDGPFGLVIPVGVTVPIDLEIPVSLTVPIPIDEVVSVSTDIAVDLTVPVAFAVADTDLVRLVDGLQSMVAAVTEVVDSLQELESIGS